MTRLTGISGGAAKTESTQISWIGWKNALVEQTVVKHRRGEDREQTVAVFAGNPKVAKILSSEPWPLPPREPRTPKVVGVAGEEPRDERGRWTK